MEPRTERTRAVKSKAVSPGANGSRQPATVYFHSSLCVFPQAREGRAGTTIFLYRPETEALPGKEFAPGHRTQLQSPNDNINLLQRPANTVFPLLFIFSIQVKIKLKL